MIVSWVGLVLAVAAQGDASLETRVKNYETPRNFGLDLQYSQLRYSRYYFNDDTTMEGFGNAGHLAFEWLPVQRYGKLGLGAGVGFFRSGTAALANDVEAVAYAIPFELFATYRFDYIDNQILVPYIKGGVELTSIKQTASDGDQSRPWKIYSGLEYGFGVQLCLNALEPSSAKKLDRSTGINSTYLVAEYLRSQPFQAEREPDLTHQQWRFGLRFEM